MAATTTRRVGYFELNYYCVQAHGTIKQLYAYRGADRRRFATKNSMHIVIGTGGLVGFQSYHTLTGETG
jgi:hypothetical protein